MALDISVPFGKIVSKVNSTNPNLARKILKLGWQAMNIKLRRFPDKRLTKADQYLSDIMMQAMIAPLKEPHNSALVSIFTPCELLQEVGLNPYNAETYSSYISASCIEAQMLKSATDAGASETLCSYHRIFLGGAISSLMPKPRCIVYTNLACDANMISFKKISEIFKVPIFYIDVPANQDDSSITYVANQLRELKSFLEEISGKKIDESNLIKRVEVSRNSLNDYRKFQRLRADYHVPTDVVSPLYCCMSNNILLGTNKQRAFTKMLVDGLKDLEPKRGKHIYWMHTIPFWSSVIKDIFEFSDRVQIVGDEIGEVCDCDFDPADPYEAMAKRMVYNILNGSAKRRIEAGIKHAKIAGADGAIWFNHWGCKHTIGSSILAKKLFEEAGIPLLVLDGDGCDKSHGGEGQTSTRINAFLEMLDG